MRFKLSMSLALLAVTIMAGTALAQDNYSQWSNYRDVILNTKASGANVAANQVNFPVLVRLTATDTAVFNHAIAGGADIRFAKPSGKHLSYQIEQWNATAKTAAIWVRADTIKGNDSSVCFKMYWGKTGAADSSNGKAVFDTATGYQGVWHMNGPVGVGDSDATVNNYFAKAMNSPADTLGMIGRGKWFNHSTTYDTIIGSVSSKLNFLAGSNYTLSAWICPDTFPSPGWRDSCYYAIISKGNTQYALAIGGVDTLSARYGIPEMMEYRSTWSNTHPIIMPTTRQWMHVVGRVATSPAKDFDTVTTYVNGATIGSSAIATGTSAQVVTGDVCLGRQSSVTGSTTSSPYRVFNGMIDEVEMANVARDTNWIQLSYQNQKASQTLVFVVGTTTSGIAGRQPVSLANAVGNGSTIRLSVAGKTSAECHFASAKVDGVKIAIIDLYGRTVWNKTINGSVREIAWDGSTISGRKAVSGTYIVRITTLGSSSQIESASTKLLLMR